MDPAGRRARNVVLLVILTVALPSLLLTALGAAAVRNEEAAAKRRVEKLYGPVVSEVAKVFNDRFDELVAASDPLLAELAKTGVGAAPDLEALDRFVEAFPFATNFFVISDAGELLVPGRPSVGALAATGPLAALRAIDPPTPVVACSLPPSCFAFPPPNLEADTGDPEASCPPDLRREAAAILTSSSCADGLEPSDAERLQALLIARPPKESAQVEAYVRDALAFARRLDDPRRPLPNDWVERAAAGVIEVLHALPRASSRSALAHYAALAHRSDLFAMQATVAHPSTGDPALTGMGGKEWRRVVIAASHRGVTAGFELVPTVFEMSLCGALVDRGLDDALQAYLGPVGTPDWWFPLLYPEVAAYVAKKDDSREAAWALLSKTQLNWALSLILKDQGLLPNLARSRSGLYLWALVLIGAALLIGIVYTVRSVVAEARLSRLKTDFVSSVSHDLRTPLTSIRMFSEMLHRKQVRSPAEEEEYLGIIVEETERLSRLVERILDFSRMEAGRKAYSPAPTPVLPIVEHALRATLPMTQDGGFEVEVDVDPGLPQVFVDRDSIIEVLVNLVSNAVRYSPDQRKIRIWADQVDGVVRIHVKDHGIGISESEQRRIFEKFYRVNNWRTAEVSGSGIGLSLVDHIVSAHGGAVSVDSAPGEGSTFTVGLPVRPSEDGAAAARASGPRRGGNRWRASSS